MSVVRVVVLSTLVIVPIGCAPKLTPLQERAWDAFKDCQNLAPTAQLTWLLPDGRLGFQSREGDYQIMIRCLEERHGYKFR